MKGEYDEVRIFQGASGMTLRDYFAAKAMAAMVGATCEVREDGIIKNIPRDISEIAYTYADAMLEVRNK